MVHNADISTSTLGLSLPSNGVRTPVPEACDDSRRTPRMPTLRGSPAAFTSYQTPPLPFHVHAKSPSFLRPPGAGDPMMRRILVIALAAAAVFAAILGAASPAQDPDGHELAREHAHGDRHRARGERGARGHRRARSRRPAETPTQAPTETATQAPTADAPTPEPPPPSRPRPPPRPPRPRARPRRATRPQAAGPAKGVTRKSPTKKANTEEKIVKVEKKKCSTSTSGRDCKSREAVS